MKRLGRLAILLLAMGILLAVGVQLGSTGGFPAQPEARRPIVAAPARLAEDQGLLKVPPAGADPVITAEEAIAIAWNDRPAGGADTVTATLALLDDGYFAPPGGMLVWAVHYGGACVAPAGPGGGPEGSGACVANDWTVIVDAVTGEFVEAGT